MANTYRYRRGPKIIRYGKKTGTVEIQIGDFIGITSSGKVKEITASGDANSLVGIAMTQSPTTDATATEIEYLEGGHGTVFECGVNVATAALYMGDCFVISASQTLTKKSVTNPLTTATDVVAVCVKDSVGSAGTVEVELAGTRMGGFKIVES